MKWPSSTLSAASRMTVLSVLYRCYCLPMIALFIYFHIMHMYSALRLYTRCLLYPILLLSSRGRPLDFPLLLHFLRSDALDPFFRNFYTKMTYTYANYRIFILIRTQRWIDNEQIYIERGKVLIAWLESGYVLNRVGRVRGLKGRPAGCMEKGKLRSALVPNKVCLIHLILLQEVRGLRAFHYKGAIALRPKDSCTEE